MREEPRLSGPFVIKWVDFYANSSKNGLLVEQHVPLAGDSQTNSRKALVEVPLLAATQIDRDRFPTFSYFYNSSEWERARFAYVRVRTVCFQCTAFLEADFNRFTPIAGRA
jgi:hypothetical protein